MHDYRNLVRGRLAAEDFADGETIDATHHYVHHDQVGQKLLRLVDGFERNLE